jgi:hypothetical protein
MEFIKFVERIEAHGPEKKSSRFFQQSALKKNASYGHGCNKLGLRDWKKIQHDHNDGPSIKGNH